MSFFPPHQTFYFTFNILWLHLLVMHKMFSRWQQFPSLVSGRLHSQSCPPSQLRQKQPNQILLFWTDADLLHLRSKPSSTIEELTRWRPGNKISSGQKLQNEPMAYWFASVTGQKKKCKPLSGRSIFASHSQENSKFICLLIHWCTHETALIPG